MKLVTVGDNVCDCYVDEGIYYPGGNCVNVAVHAKRAGAERAAYIGVLGTDDKAEHVRRVLTREGVEISRCRVVEGVTGQPGVRIDEKGDRIFFRRCRETVQNKVALKLTETDLDYIRDFDCLHTSCYSFTEREIAKVKGLCKIAYDYSDLSDIDELEPSIAWADYVFLSSARLEEDRRDEVIRYCLGRGAELVCITDGPRPVLLATRERRFTQSPLPVRITDTMGAGDSFIAGFLTKYLNSYTIPESLHYAATCAKKTCESSGGIGYPQALT